MTIPNEHREALGLPLVDYKPSEGNQELYRSDHPLDDLADSERHVILEARRGRGGGSKRVRPKPSRKKRPSKPKQKKPKKKPAKRPQKPKNPKRPKKPTSKKHTSKSASKTTKNVWPTPSVSHPTTAIDPCDLFLDCSNDAAALKDAGIKARNVEDFVIDMHITDAPVPTQVAAYVDNDKRDIRTQKPKMGAAGVLTIKNLDYPGSGKLFNGAKPAHHAFQFSTNSVKDAKVKDLRRKPAKTSDFATEHIVELQTLGKFLETVARTKSTLATFLYNNWNKKLTTKQLNARTNIPSYGKRTIPSDATFNNLVFNAFGSQKNLDDFVLCDDKINSYKARVWAGIAPMSPRTFEQLVTKSLDGKRPSNEYLTALKMTFGVFEYMQQTIVTQNMRRVIDNVGKELANAEDIFPNFPKNVDLEQEWDTYIRGQLNMMSTKAQAWAKKQIAHATTEVTREITVLNTALKKIQAAEKKATAAYKKNKATTNKQLTTQINRHQTEITKILKKIKALETQRAKAPSGALTKQIKSQKQAWQRKVEARGAAERKRAMLYSTGIKKLIAGLKEDQAVLKRYKAKISADLKMPTP